jgi:hypothetical protein
MQTWIQIATVAVALTAPTLAVIVANRKNTRKLDEIHVLVNRQLSEAVERLEVALREIASLKHEAP